MPATRCSPLGGSPGNLVGSLEHLAASRPTQRAPTFPLTASRVARHTISVALATAPEFRGAQLWTRLALPVAAAIALEIYGARAFAQTEAPPRLLPTQQDLKPAFTLEDADRSAIALNDLRGQIVVVHFFATWCEPCRVELPALRRLAERDGSLRVLAISVAEPEARVRTFLEKMPLNFPVVIDRDRSVSKSWAVSALPTTYILDRELRPRLFVEQDYPWDQIDIPALETSLSIAPVQPTPTPSSFNRGEKHDVTSP